ncbi:MAG TPA: hypothetical protein VFO16_03505 [Pseudonocardiaceae bacterium]|nr:hypothetical protein [Pseudonocardiaceae bacterium]
MTQSTDHPNEVLTINDQGLVSIPAPVRKAAGIKTGIPLAVYEEDGRVMIETRDQLAERIRREVATTWTGEEPAAEELITERRAEAAISAANWSEVFRKLNQRGVDAERITGRLRILGIHVETPHRGRRRHRGRAVVAQPRSGPVPG